MIRETWNGGGRSHLFFFPSFSFFFSSFSFSLISISVLYSSLFLSLDRIAGWREWNEDSSRFFVFSLSLFLFLLTLPLFESYISADKWGEKKWARFETVVEWKWISYRLVNRGEGSGKVGPVIGDAITWPRACRLVLFVIYVTSSTKVKFPATSKLYFVRWFKDLDKRFKKKTRKRRFTFIVAMAWLVSDEQPSLFKQRTRGEILYILLQKRSFFFLLFFFRFRFFKIRGYLKKCNLKTMIGETCSNDKKSLIEIKNVSSPRSSRAIICI